MRSPVLTVLIPTYNRPRLLRRTLISVLTQSFADLIVRVHDNASGRETQKLLLEMSNSDRRIRYTRHDENIGALRNFKTLTDSVDTPFYTLISDDDFFMPDHIKNGIEALLSNPSAFFYSSATVTANLNRGFLEFRNCGWETGLQQPSLKNTLSVIREHFTSTGTIFSRSVLDVMGGFHSIGCDDLLSIMLTGAFPFYSTPRIGAVYTINENRGLTSYVDMVRMEEIESARCSDIRFISNYAHSTTRKVILDRVRSYYAKLVAAKLDSVYSKESAETHCRWTAESLKDCLMTLRGQNGFKRLIRRHCPKWVLNKVILAKMTVCTSPPKYQSKIKRLPMAAQEYLQWEHECQIDELHATCLKMQAKHSCMTDRSPVQ